MLCIICMEKPSWAEIEIEYFIEDYWNPDFDIGNLYTWNINVKISFSHSDAVPSTAQMK